MQNGPGPANKPWRWPSLHDGQRLLLREVLLHGSRSRAALSRRLGLSRTSLTRLARELVELGFLEEGEVRPLAGRGRPSEMLDLQPRSAFFAGFKLTGDSLYAVVTDLQARIVTRVSHALPPGKAVGDVVRLIVDVVADERSRTPRLGAIGVCLAGDVEIVNGRAEVVGSAFLGWQRAPLEALLVDATGLPVSISNDVQALTVGHHWFGTGVGSSSLVLTSFGAGVGTGVVAHNELVRGAHGHAGRLGHMRLGERDGDPQCELGHLGCVSAWATEKFFVRNAGAGDVGEALRLVERGNPRAVWAARGLAAAIGALTAETVNLVDPERVIVTGEGLTVLQSAEDAFWLALRDRSANSDVLPPVVLQEFDFSDYAWAAAITAIRSVIKPLDASSLL